MPAIHRVKDLVRAGLHRKMKIGHQCRYIAMRENQVIIHIERMGCGVADAVEAIDLGKLADQPRKAPDAAVRRFTVIGVYILPEKSQLAGAGCHKAARLFDDALCRPREFRAARIGNHTEGTELVASFLHRKKGRRSARRMLARQLVKLDFLGKLGVDGAGTGGRIGTAHKLRQPVIGLRPDNDIDPWRAAGDFLALCLGNAASNSDGDIASLLVTGMFFHHPETAQLGEDLLRRLLANVAGVEDDHVRPVRLRCRRIAERRQNICHAIGIIDIHLAPVGLDEQLFCHNRSLPEGVDNAGCSRPDSRAGQAPAFGRQSGKAARSQGTTHDQGIDQLAITAIIARTTPDLAEFEPFIKCPSRRIVDRNFEADFLDTFACQISQRKQKKPCRHTAPRQLRRHRHRNDIGAATAGEDKQIAHRVSTEIRNDDETPKGRARHQFLKIAKVERIGKLRRLDGGNGFKVPGFQCHRDHDFDGPRKAGAT